MQGCKLKLRERDQSVKATLQIVLFFSYARSKLKSLNRAQNLVVFHCEGMETAPQLLRFLYNNMLLRPPQLLCTLLRRCMSVRAT